MSKFLAEKKVAEDISTTVSRVDNLKNMQTKTNEKIENIDRNYKAAVKKSKSKGFNPVFNFEMNKAQNIEFN